MAVKTSWSAGDVLAAADLTDTFAAKAPTASPTFTGTVALPSTTTLNGVTLTGGGLVLITSGTLSSSATNVVGCFSATYYAYRIVYFATTSSANVWFRYLSNTTPASGSNYITNTMYGTSTSAANYSGTATYINFAGGDASTHWGAFDIIDPYGSGETHAAGISTTALTRLDAWGNRHTVSQSYDGFQLLPASGNFGSGKVYVFGYRA